MRIGRFQIRGPAFRIFTRDGTRTVAREGDNGKLWEGGLESRSGKWRREMSEFDTGFTSGNVLHAEPGPQSDPGTLWTGEMRRAIGAAVTAGMDATIRIVDTNHLQPARDRIAAARDAIARGQYRVADEELRKAATTLAEAVAHAHGKDPDDPDDDPDQETGDKHRTRDAGRRDSRPKGNTLAHRVGDRGGQAPPRPRDVNDANRAYGIELRATGSALKATEAAAAVLADRRRFDAARGK